MRRIGSFLVGIGLLAIVLNFANMVPVILMWIYNWGEGVAWGIKIACVVVGSILWFLGKGDDDE